MSIIPCIKTLTHSVWALQDGHRLGSLLFLRSRSAI